MRKNNDIENMVILSAKTFDISMESAKKLVDANFTLENKEKFLSMDEYDITAVCYKIICEEEKHYRENNQLYNPKRKNMAEEIYSKFSKEGKSSMRNSVDTLSFKKLIVKTDPELTDYEREYTLAEILINDQPFLNIIKKYEEQAALKAGNEHWYCEYDYNIAYFMYKELTGKSTHHDCKHYLRGIDAVLLTNSTCYIDCDFPLIVRTKETENKIIWTKYYNCRAMNYDRSQFPVFRFEKEQYRAALEQLKVIAGL